MSWLPERADWLRADEAAAWLRVTPGNLRVIAHRRHWRTLRIGRASAYLADDVADEAQRRAEKRAATSANHNDVTCSVDRGYV